MGGSGGLSLIFALVAGASAQSVVTVAGGGVSGTLEGSNDGSGTAARFYFPYGVAVDAAGVTYVADSGNHKIRVIYSNRTVVTLAGGGATGVLSGSNNGVGTAARFSTPRGIAVNINGTISSQTLLTTRFVCCI